MEKRRPLLSFGSITQCESLVDDSANIAGRSREMDEESASKRPSFTAFSFSFLIRIAFFSFFAKKGERAQSHLFCKNVYTESEYLPTNSYVYLALAKKRERERNPLALFSYFCALHKAQKDVTVYFLFLRKPY